MGEIVMFFQSFAGHSAETADIRGHFYPQLVLPVYSPYVCIEIALFSLWLKQFMNAMCRHGLVSSCEAVRKVH